MDIEHQGVHVEDAKSRSWPALLDEQLVRHAIVNHCINTRGVLEHLILVLSHVIHRLIAPVIVVKRATIFWSGVHWRDVQRCFVQQDEVPATGPVYVVKCLPNAIQERCDAVPCNILVA